MRTISIPLTTDADGNLTTYSATPVNGQVIGVLFKIGTLASGDVDYTLTTEDSFQTIDARTNLPSSLLVVELSLSGLSAVCFAERLKVVITGGGNKKTGYLKVVLQDEYVLYS